jgi:hypothetical protein
MKSCDVTIETRSFCSECRWLKCLKNGMSLININRKKTQQHQQQQQQEEHCQVLMKFDIDNTSLEALNRMKYQIDYNFDLFNQTDTVFGVVSNQFEAFQTQLLIDFNITINNNDNQQKIYKHFVLFCLLFNVISFRKLTLFDYHIDEILNRMTTTLFNDTSMSVLLKLNCFISVLIKSYCNHQNCYPIRVIKESIRNELKSKTKLKGSALFIHYLNQIELLFC